MKKRMEIIRPYMPWLLLLFAMDVFAALLLWIADVQAFYAMIVVIVIATVLLFSLILCVIIHREQKKEQAFLSFLSNPDAYHEKLLLEIVSGIERESVLLLGKILRDKQLAYARLETQLADYEEYVESWAHETKTPLSLLTLLLDNRRDELPSSINFKLNYIRNRMQESVDQMLFYARVKSARKDYLFENIPIRVCIEDLLEDYGPLLEEKQFQILLSLADDTVYSDRRGLSFLIAQVISNSIKYCGEEPELCFSSFQRDGCYVLNIKDNGIGVRSCDLPYIFEKGFTGDSGDGRKKATGMGLFLAKEIAKELNVTLNASSEWGQGFEMLISFPMIEAEK